MGGPECRAPVNAHKSASWRTFDEAVEAMREHGLDGIGLSLNGTGLTALDWDCCTDELGGIKPEVEAWLARLGSYTEWSPSGKGLHTYVRGSVLPPGKNELGLEVYSETQFLTITGDALRKYSTEVAAGDEVAQTLCELVDACGGPRAQKSPLGDVPPPPYIDVEKVRTLTELVRDGVITEEWRALIRSALTWEGRYLKSDGKTLNYSDALMGIALRFKHYGGTAEEFLWHCSEDGVNAITACAQRKSSPLDWLWEQTAFEVFGTAPREAQVLAMFEDLDASDWGDDADARFGAGVENVAGEPAHAAGGTHETRAPRTPAEREAQAAKAKAEEIERLFTPVQVPDGLENMRIEPRRWLIEKRLLRGYVSADIAPGGTGKSMISLVEALSIATGRDLLGLGELKERTNALVINNEDEYEELHRRLQGAMRYFGISSADIKDRLFILSGYGRPFMVAQAQPKDRHVINPGEAVALMTRFCTEKGVGAVILDPLVSLHNLDENDNNAMNDVFNKLRDFAKETGAAVRVVAHTRKLEPGKDSESYAGNAEHARGGKAVIDAARCAHTVAKMSSKTAERLGIEPELRRRLVRIDNGKMNFALADEEAIWLKLESVRLKSDEEDVGVPVPFDITPYQEAAGKAAALKENLELRAARADVLAAMAGSTEVRLAKLRDDVMSPKWLVSPDTAERRIKGAIPEGRENAVSVHSAEAGEQHLWRDREGTHATAPIVIRREAAPGLAEPTSEDWECKGGPTTLVPEPGTSGDVGAAAPGVEGAPA